MVLSLTLKCTKNDFISTISLIPQIRTLVAGNYAGRISLALSLSASLTWNIKRYKTGLEYRPRDIKRPAHWPLQQVKVSSSLIPDASL